MDNEHVNTFFGHPLPFDIYSAIFASLVLIGGLIGYFKAGSTPSLIAGISFAIILAIGTYFSSVNAQNVYLLLVTSIILGGMMGHRAITSKKFMPAGLVTLISVIMILRYVTIIVKHFFIK
ncbi:transmembrane protein 14A-like [Brevipalpus obovatus]|uniref:transmembrane protein 14A-like n=1 Tax=Brevipalpus obovatus TaxID=246614 RepID=UPI003D9EC966